MEAMCEIHLTDSVKLFPSVAALESTHCFSLFPTQSYRMTSIKCIGYKAKKKFGGGGGSSSLHFHYIKQCRQGILKIYF